MFVNDTKAKPLNVRLPDEILKTATHRFGDH